MCLYVYVHVYAHMCVCAPMEARCQEQVTFSISRRFIVLRHVFLTEPGARPLGQRRLDPQSVLPHAGMEITSPTEPPSQLLISLCL